MLIFRQSISKCSVLKSKHMWKRLCSNVCKSLLFCYVSMKNLHLVKTPLNVGFLWTLVANLSFLQQILTCKNEVELSSSCSRLECKVWCVGDIYIRNEWAQSRDAKSTKISSTYFLSKVGSNSTGHPLRLFSSWCERKRLTNIGPRGDPHGNTIHLNTKLVLSKKWSFGGQIQ